MPSNTKEYMKKYYRANKQRLLAGAKKWKIDHPWYMAHTSARQRCTNVSNTSYSQYGGKGIKFSMTLLDFELLWKRDRADRMKQPSIDRIDSRGNYELSNCRYIELRQNSAKGRPTKDMGVYWFKRTKKWMAKAEGGIYLGYFKSKEAARRSIKRYQKQFGGI